MSTAAARAEAFPPRDDNWDGTPRFTIDGDASQRLNGLVLRITDPDMLGLGCAERLRGLDKRGFKTYAPVIEKYGTFDYDTAVGCIQNDQRASACRVIEKILGVSRTDLAYFRSLFEPYCVYINPHMIPELIDSAEALAGDSIDAKYVRLAVYVRFHDSRNMHSFLKTQFWPRLGGLLRKAHGEAGAATLLHHIVTSQHTHLINAQEIARERETGAALRNNSTSYHQRPLMPDTSDKFDPETMTLHAAREDRVHPHWTSPCLPLVVYTYNEWSERRQSMVTLCADLAVFRRQTGNEADIADHARTAGLRIFQQGLLLESGGTKFVQKGKRNEGYKDVPFGPWLEVCLHHGMIVVAIDATRRLRELAEEERTAASFAGMDDAMQIVREMQKQAGEGDGEAEASASAPAEASADA